MPKPSKSRLCRHATWPKRLNSGIALKHYLTPKPSLRINGTVALRLEIKTGKDKDYDM